MGVSIYMFFMVWLLLEEIDRESERYTFLSRICRFEFLVFVVVFAVVCGGLWCVVVCDGACLFVCCPKWRAPGIHA